MRSREDIGANKPRVTKLRDSYVNALIAPRLRFIRGSFVLPSATFIVHQQNASGIREDYRD